MSSHHIIREDQEPALVIDNASPQNLESIQQLLEWSPTVIVTEQALDQVLSWGIKIDIVIALEPHVEALKNSLRNQFPLKVLSCTSEAEAVSTALYFLTASKQKAVNIISDVALEAFEKFPALDIAVVQTRRRWVFIRNGHFKKWLPAYTNISIYPDSAHPEPILEQDAMINIHCDHSFWISEKN